MRWTGPQLLKQLPQINVFCAGMGSAGQYYLFRLRSKDGNSYCIDTNRLRHRNWDLFEGAQAIGHRCRVSPNAPVSPRLPFVSRQLKTALTFRIKCLQLDWRFHPRPQTISSFSFH